MRLNKEKAITLISLVVTIIILLILAVVTISLFIGNGIMEKAKFAKDITLNAQQEESSLLENYANQTYELSSSRNNENSTQNLHIESGTVSGTITSGYLNDIPIVFKESFEDTNYAITATMSLSNYYTEVASFTVVNKTMNGCTLRVYNRNTSSFSMSFDYIAVHD